MTFLFRSTAFFLTPLLALGPLFAQSAVNETLQLRVAESDGTQILPGSRSAKGFSVVVTDGNGAPVSDAAVVFRLPDAAATGIFSDGSHSAVAYTDASGTAHISGIQWGATPGAVTIRVTATRGSAHAGTLIEETLANAPAPVTPAPAPAALASKQPEPQRPTDPETIAKEVAPPVPAAPHVQILNDIEPSSRSTNTRTTIAPMIRDSGSAPAISITSGPGEEKSHSSKKKWLIIAGVAAAAGAGAMLAMRSHSSTAAASTGVSIGAPTINIGH